MSIWMSRTLLRLLKAVKIKQCENNTSELSYLDRATQLYVFLIRPPETSPYYMRSRMNHRFIGSLKSSGPQSKTYRKDKEAPANAWVTREYWTKRAAWTTGGLCQKSYHRKQHHENRETSLWTRVLGDVNEVIPRHEQEQVVMLLACSCHERLKHQRSAIQRGVLFFWVYKLFIMVLS
jgi:hypothetical protein